ncbi:hypothetical protein CHS0354_008362 [Potamilus streckersoni]|uniref:Uncharacterized protein n=1 Tax=Potamilus streckersoni TaxID=2493646 RepID=A0AAE0VGD1_9BIVA|nr:hypothetical protein CHS0354_008362 [Potamilus streckersoni]
MHRLLSLSLFHKDDHTIFERYFTVMIPKNFIIFAMFLMCAITVTGAGLVHDTCHNVSIRENITKQAAKVVCIETDRVHDPKSQTGSYLMDDTGNWEGEIFACLCSCQLPFEPQNGQILSKNIVLHGETLNYSCDYGYISNIDKNISCHDGLLMTVPDSFEKKHINISFRQKSLRDSFARGEVYHLCINETAISSEAEIRKKQKVFECLPENEKELWYSLSNGSNYMLGYVNLTMKQTLQCMKTNGPPASSDQGKSEQLSGGSIAGIAVGVTVFVIPVIVGV